MRMQIHPMKSEIKGNRNLQFNTKVKKRKQINILLKICLLCKNVWNKNEKLQKVLSLN